MANQTGLDGKLIDAAVIEFTDSGGNSWLDPRIEAITDTDESGTENVVGPNRVLGFVNTAGGHTATYDSSIPVNRATTKYPPYKKWSESKETLDLTLFLGTTNAQNGFVASTGQTFFGVRATVNLTTGTPAKFNITLTAVGADPEVEFPIA
jgi:hypothetical protein